jgi:hypothetical protein
MRTDASVTNDDPGLGGGSRECPTAAELVELLQTAYPINWEQHLRKRLDTFGVADPADLTPAKLAEFRNDVFRAVKQVGIKDPTAWILRRAQAQPKAPVSQTRSTGQVKAAAGQPKSAENDPVALESSPARASAARALPLSRTAICGTTKAEVLGRAKVAVETGESPRIIAARLACAHQDFRASQREIGRAIGRSASWVNRLLQWRRSAYEQRSPFGPTTRAGRAAHRNHGDNHAGRCVGAEQPENEGGVRVVADCSPPSQPASPPAPVNENLPGGPGQIEVLSGGEADRIEEEATRVEGSGQPSKKQKLSARNAKIGLKLSPERMRIVIEALREYPILATAAAKAGIHRKTLTYWFKCSEAGQDGYDIEWEDFQWRFHEACQAAMELAHDRLLGLIYDNALGPITYQIDKDLVDLGMEGADAYARDENGDLIEEARGPGNEKLLKFWLRLRHPEIYAKRQQQRSLRSGGVLVIGGGTRRPETNCTATIKARQWKSALRRVGEIKA